MRTARLFFLALTGLATGGSFANAQVTYQLDNGTGANSFNHADGPETTDGWVGNVFPITASGQVINRVDWGYYNNTPGAVAQVVLYRVTDPGGNPANGATRVYTQSFNTLPGANDGVFTRIQQIPLTTPHTFNTGDLMLVAIFQANVIALPPNDVYPWVNDASGSTAGSYWDRAAPNTFNLDDLSNSRHLDQPFVTGGFAVGAVHPLIRAFGSPVPEPTSLALLGLAGAAGLYRRRKTRLAEHAAIG
jgi:hypothetical protein